MKLLAVVGWLALLMAQPQPINTTQDFPFLPPLQGARLTQTSKVSSPLELKSATAEDEAVLAGMSHIKKSYQRTSAISSMRFVSSYRDALFAAGWKLIDVTKLGEPALPETVMVSAQYMENGRNIYARVSLEPDGPYEVNVADVGAEDWSSAIARDCRVRIYTVHFDLDRATIRTFESEPTLEKLATLLKSKAIPALEIQGHMDNIGQAAIAPRQALAEARANSVRDWLTSHGVPAARISARGYGKTRPIADNDSDLGRALNRRIELACLRR